MKFLVMFAAVLALAAGAEYLKTLNDNFKFEDLSRDELEAVAKCFMGQGPCNELMLSYKQHYPAVVVDACGRCNDAQKHISNVYFTRMRAELPQVYQDFRKHMDPEGKYFDNFLAAIEKH